MVERAFKLLDLLATSEAGYSLSELARLLDMSKGSAFGLLRTLEHGGVVEIDEDRRYALGPRLYNLTEAYIHGSGLRRFALPAMQRLAATTGETVFLGQVEPDGVRIVDLVEIPSGHTALRLSARRGAHIHLLAGATGRVVLANWPESRRREYLRRGRCHASPNTRSPIRMRFWPPRRDGSNRRGGGPRRIPGRRQRRRRRRFMVWEASCWRSSGSSALAPNLPMRPSSGPARPSVEETRAVGEALGGGKLAPKREQRK